MNNVVKIYINNTRDCVFRDKDTCPSDKKCNCSYTYKHINELTEFEKVLNNIRNDLVSSKDISQFTDRLTMIQNGMTLALHMTKDFVNKVNMELLLADVSNELPFKINL